MEFVGLVPAAGLAKRLGDIPVSKEILPIPLGDERKKVFSEFLLEAYQLAGIKKIHFIIRKGKWDIPEYFGNGSAFQLSIGYLMMRYPYGVPFTLYESCPFVASNAVALGFPDIIFSPKNAFGDLFDKLDRTNADVVLGLFPVETKDKWDMVELDGNGDVKKIVIKQSAVDLRYGWTIAVWRPTFTEYLKAKIEETLKKGSEGKIETSGGSFRELYPGDLFNLAIEDGLKVENVRFEKGRCIDLGTKDDWERFTQMRDDFDL